MIEITHSTSRYTYKIEADSPRVIQRRLNRHNARWAEWRMFATADEARAYLIRLTKPNDEDAK